MRQTERAPRGHNIQSAIVIAALFLAWFSPRRHIAGLYYPTRRVDEKVSYEKWDEIDWILLAARGCVVPDTKPVFGGPGTWLECAKCAFCKNQSELIIFVQNFVPKYVQNFVPKYVYPHTRERWRNGSWTTCVVKGKFIFSVEGNLREFTKEHGANKDFC